MIVLTSLVNKNSSNIFIKSTKAFPSTGRVGVLRVFIGLRQPDGFGFVDVLSVKQRSSHVSLSVNRLACASRCKLQSVEPKMLSASWGIGALKAFYTEVLLEL